MTDHDEAATRLLEAFDNRISIATGELGKLSAEDAYHVASILRMKREARGEIPVGRKIGFTNSRIWAEYGISEPIWGYMYKTTVRPAASDGPDEIGISHLLEPRIEPEIAFGIREAPAPGMDEAELLECVEWVAHGMEIVHSLYPAWKCDVTEAIAAHGMHGCYLLGARHRISEGDRETMRDRLVDFEVTLFRDGEIADRGHGSNVLGGPLTALRHLVDLLDRCLANSPLTPGEIVTTGSLTRALPVKAGETWHTEIKGLPLPGLIVATV